MGLIKRESHKGGVVRIDDRQLLRLQVYKVKRLEVVTRALNPQEAAFPGPYEMIRGLAAPRESCFYYAFKGGRRLGPDTSDPRN